MIQRNALVVLALLLAGCPGDMPNRGYEHAVSLVDGPVRENTASASDRAFSVEAPKAKLDSKPRPPDGKPGPPDSKAVQLDWGANDIGKPCLGNGDCAYGLCATNTHTGVKFCTKTCDPCSTAPCPTGSGCQNAGLAYICAPGYPNAPCP